MRVVKCTMCGFAAAREMSRCPNCREKSLVFCHSFNTSESAVYQLVRNEKARGCHPLMSLAALVGVTLFASVIVFSWMYPGKVPTDQLPRALAGLTQAR